VLELRPFVADDLAGVEPWFDDAEAQRWLGGRHWPAQSFRLVGEDRHMLLAVRVNEPVGLIDIETYRGSRASFAIVVAPALRGRGLGREVLAAAIGHPLFAGIGEWFAGIERGNDASRRLVLTLGFRQVADEDADGFTYFARGADPAQPWCPPD
jgi:RimJ/RimL family protein N-acetyltransferase